ncbi:MAG: molecular chaperone GrpE [Clostridia bacterium]|jgi:molecular chaperone GrpE|nr:hypothetical protein [Clostridiales bacterium]MDK2984992.1 molecular chaperone GrpE [Clostridia bacterium]
MKENGNGELKDDVKKEINGEETQQEEITEKTATSEERKKTEEAASEMTLQECFEVIKNLHTDLENAQREKEESIFHLQRLQAEFDNFRKRTRKEKEELVKSANAELIQNILPIIDNFDRALEAGKEQFGETSFYEGVKMIYNGLYDVLQKVGLQPIDAVGCNFDPEKHQAVMQVEASSEYPDNTVVEELQKGYLLNDKVLRPSMVKVAKDN